MLVASDYLPVDLSQDSLGTFCLIFKLRSRFLLFELKDRDSLLPQSNSSARFKLQLVVICLTTGTCSLHELGLSAVEPQVFCPVGATCRNSLVFYCVGSVLDSPVLSSGPRCSSPCPAMRIGASNIRGFVTLVVADIPANVSYDVVISGRQLPSVMLISSSTPVRCYPSDSSQKNVFFWYPEPLCSHIVPLIVRVLGR